MNGESESFDITEVERFTAGTVGAPGQRTFYLQVTAHGRHISLKLEKQQVLALAEYIDNMLTDLPEVDESTLPVDLSLADPIIAEWTVEKMGVAYAQSQNCLILWAEELVFEEDEDFPADPATARFQIGLPLATGFVHQARRIVAAGRPPCPYCGAPMNAEGDWCACSN